jgi:hypothetical protein
MCFINDILKQIIVAYIDSIIEKLEVGVFDCFYPIDIEMLMITLP